MSGVLSNRMSELYGPLNFSTSGLSSSSSGLPATSCSSHFRRSPSWMTSQGRSNSDLDSASFPSDPASDDSSGPGDLHFGHNSQNRNQFSSSHGHVGRNRKRSRRDRDHLQPEMMEGGDHPLALHQLGVSGGAFNTVVQPKVIRQTANARERDRTHSVNSAFVTLRTMIPTEPVDRKLSKIETLRLATSYISHLHTMLVVGLDVREQPCLKHQSLVGRRSGGGGRGGSGEESGTGRLASVCTFCLTASKSLNKQVRAEQCMFPDRRMHVPR